MTDLFKDRAKDFDANDIPRQLSANIGATLLRRVKLEKGMDVMDFGAGTGLITAQIVPHVHKVTAVDISPAMLEQLLSKHHLKGKVETICQDITTQPLGRKFDVIVSAMAMHHIHDTDRMVRSLAEHLKPGGQIALADLDSEDGTFHHAGIQGVYHSGFDRAAFQAILAKHGFHAITFTTAHTVQRDGKEYPVFLVVARR
jgi:2-polyprenyl-3-methyl-5-hydroxy-6-metoxy-1,4-benzoquinol methylase